MTKNPGRIRRRQMIVDARMQIAVMLMVVSAPLLIAFVYMSAVSLFPEEAAPIAFTAAEAKDLAMRINFVYCFFCMIAMGGVAIVFTHRVAGPAMVLERAVEAFLKGDFGPRLKLRKDDYLKNLASAMARLAEQMESDRDRRREAVDSLAQALAGDDLEAARRHLQTLRDMTPPAEQESPESEISGEAAEPVRQLATSPEQA